MRSDSQPTFAALLRQLRIAARMTHEDLADASDVAVRTISDLERGVAVRPRRETVRRLAGALRLDGRDRANFEAAAKEHARIGGPAAAAARGQAAAGRGLAIRMLPRDIADSFTARESELRWLAEAAATTETGGGRVAVYVIEGMAGVGKTSLAVHAGHEVAASFPDGQIFLDLHGFTEGIEPLTPGQALGSLLRTLDVPPERIPESQDDRAAVYRRVLAGSRMLIILDNAASSAQVRPLLPGAGGCLVMVTSRRKLSGLDDARPVPLRVLAEPEAITLFGTIAGARWPGEADQHLRDIVRMCGYLPLAIRLVAAPIAHPGALPIGEVARQLRQARGGLAHLQDEDRSVAGAFAVSYRSLRQAEREMFGDLGLIPGPDFDAYAAASLTGNDLGVADRMLQSLHDQNLLVQHAAGRYSFHDLIRVYARTIGAGTEGGAGAGDHGTGDHGTGDHGTGDHGAGGHRAPSAQADRTDAALDRLFSYYQQAAQTADRAIERRIPGVGRQPGTRSTGAVPDLITPDQASAWMAAELDNLQAAVEFAAANQRPARAVALSAAMAQHLRARGPWTQARALHARALEVATAAGDVSGQAQALALLGVIARQTGALQEAKDSLSLAAGLYDRLADARSRASVLVDLGITLRLISALADADRVLAEALQIYRNLGDRLGQAAALSELGIVQRQRGAFAAARTSLAEALTRYQGNQPGEAAAYAYLGSVDMATGNMAAAERSLISALERFVQLGDPIGQANCLLYLGIGHRMRADWPAAIVALTDALGLYDRLGDRRGQAGARAYLGAVQLAAGAHDRAEEALSGALRLFGELGDVGGEAETLSYYAALAAVTMGAAAARERYGRMLSLARDIGSPKDEADALDGIAASYRSEGQKERAAAHYRQALELYQRLKCDADAARVSTALSELA